jgi:3-hydroxybutyryl-CoA dehydratase
MTATPFSLDFDRLAAGTRVRTRGRTIAEADLISFSALTGDWHPQHADAQWAAESPFGERIAHGMMVLSYALGLLPIDPARVVALRGIRNVVFKRPVPIGTTISVEAEIADLRPLDDGHGLVELALRVRDADDRLLARAALEALWRREPEPATATAADGGPAGDEPIWGAASVAAPAHQAAGEGELSPLAEGRVLI